MADMRSCSKTGCRWPAAATLSYRYTTAEVWLSDLGEAHPSTHDLCPHHADDLRVPRGWSLIDERQPAEAYHEPSAAEIVERVTTLRQSVDAMLVDRTPASRRSRYATLLDTLPTYDVEEAEGPPDDTATTPSSAGTSVELPAGLVGVGVSHEMAPIARELSAARSVLAQRYLDRVTGRGDAQGAVDVRGREEDGADPADGTVGAPDADVVHQTGLRGAVVLSLSLPLRDADDTDAS